MHVRTLRLLVFLLATVALAALSNTAGRSSAQTNPQIPSGAQLVRLPGHMLPALSVATPLTTSPPASTGARAETAGSDVVTLAIVLNRSNQAAFDVYLQSVQDPHSPNFQHFLSQANLANQFGPSKQAYDAVLAYMQSQGCTLLLGSDNRLTLTVRCTKAQVEQGLNVTIADYQLGDRTFYANTADPAVPASIASFVQSVAGLDNLAQPAHDPVRFTPAAASGGPPNPQASTSIATAYDAAGAGTNGAGQKIGLVEFDNFNRSDVSSWLTSKVGPCATGGATCASGFMNRLSTFDVAGGTSVCSSGAPSCSGEGEALLDIAAIMGVAQGANYVVYDAPNGTSFTTVLNAMINDKDTIISSSVKFCEWQTNSATVTGIDSVLQSAVGSGTGVYTSTGDAGASCPNSPPQQTGTQAPADSPHVTAVGGTTLLVGSGNAYQSEAYWNGSNCGQCGAGGFGVSTFFKLPSFQSAFTSASGRSVPDVAADADPSTGIGIFQADQGGLMCCSGGTSMAAPLFAAGMALVNQKVGHLTGNLNQVLYQHANDGSFHTASSMGINFAHVGLGSFDIGKLAAAISGASPTPTPSATPTGTGTPTPTGTVTATPTAGCASVSYAAGYNLVGGPTGTALTGSAGTLFTFQATDTNYEVINGNIVTAPEAFWAFFSKATTINQPCVTGNGASVTLPANHFIMVGNPFNRSIALNASGATIYTFNTATNSYSTFTGSATLGVGQGAWIISPAAGTLNIG